MACSALVSLTATAALRASAAAWGESNRSSPEPKALTVISPKSEIRTDPNKARARCRWQNKAVSFIDDQVPCQKRSNLNINVSRTKPRAWATPNVRARLNDWGRAQAPAGKPPLGGFAVRGYSSAGCHANSARQSGHRLPVAGVWLDWTSEVPVSRTRAVRPARTSLR